MKQNAEVNLRKCTLEEWKLFEIAKDKEIDSYLQTEAIIPLRKAGIDPDRLMWMRWVLTWQEAAEDDPD